MKFRAFLAFGKSRGVPLAVDMTDCVSSVNTMMYMLSLPAVEKFGHGAFSPGDR
jgi:hypothetical protein